MFWLRLAGPGAAGWNELATMIMKSAQLTASDSHRQIGINPPNAICSMLLNSLNSVFIGSLSKKGLRSLGLRLLSGESD